MARRRHENGLKYQQRIENEQRRANGPDQAVEQDNRQAEPTPSAPVPPGVTQLFENVAPPLLAPHDPNRH
jgi:hypothetical protein